MIREGRKLPPLVTDRIPDIIEEVSKDSAVVALISFGSLAKGALKPLSDKESAIMDDRIKAHLQHSISFRTTWKISSCLKNNCGVHQKSVIYCYRIES